MGVAAVDEERSGRQPEDEEEEDVDRWELGATQGGGGGGGRQQGPWTSNTASTDWWRSGASVKSSNRGQRKRRFLVDKKVGSEKHRTVQPQGNIVA